MRRILMSLKRRLERLHQEIPAEFCLVKSNLPICHCKCNRVMGNRFLNIVVRSIGNKKESGSLIMQAVLQLSQLHVWCTTGSLVCPPDVCICEIRAHCILKPMARVICNSNSDLDGCLCFWMQITKSSGGTWYMPIYATVVWKLTGNVSSGGNSTFIVLASLLEIIPPADFPLQGSSAYRQTH